MRNNIVRLASAVSLLTIFAFTACQKENLGDGVFTATIEQSTSHGKTAITPGTTSATMTWKSGDRIAVYDNNNNSGVYSTTSNAATASFSYVSGTDFSTSSSNNYRAIFPDTLAVGPSTVRIPVAQTYDDDAFNAPMYSVSDDTELAFKNLCSVLCITFPDEDETHTVSRIVVSTPDNGAVLTGNFTVNYNSDDLELTAPTSNGGHSITLDCNDAAASNAFYIYIPPNDYANGELKITVNFSNEQSLVKSLYRENSTDDLSISRNSYYTIAFSSVPQGAINGLFTINSDGDQVYFSKGNLQYNISADQWSFMEHQWSTVENNGSVGENYANQNVVSLFCWGTSGWTGNNLATGYSPAYLDYYRMFDKPNCTNGKANYTLANSAHMFGPRTVVSGTSTTAVYNTLYDLCNITGHDFGEADWSYHNAITNGGNTVHTWRTLTKGEWYYLLNTRTNASSKYGPGTVNGVNGLIILPDEFTDPNKNNGNGAFASSTTSNYNFSMNIYSGTDWTAMESNGAVFLPCAGKRENETVSYKGNYCSYHSVSCGPSDANAPKNMKYYNTSISLQSGSVNISTSNLTYRHVASCVRAVQDYDSSSK